MKNATTMHAKLSGNGILFQKLFCPTVKKKFDREIILKIRDLRLRTCKHFEITRTIFWNSEMLEQSLKQNNF